MNEPVYFPFSIFHISFVIALITARSMTNDKWKMENGKCRGV